MNKLFWILGTVGITAVVVYIILIIFLMMYQSKMIYLPSREMGLTPGDIGLNYEDIEFHAEDNVKLHGWFVPSDSAIGTLLFCHGNAGNISGRLETIRLFNKMNLSVFIFDYRGYGNSESEQSEKGTYLDTRAAWNYLISNKSIEENSIIILGRSLGGAIASNLAVDVAPAGLIVESAFKSIQKFGTDMYPYIPVKLISRFTYDTGENVRKADCPVLVVHSPDDDVIPYHHGREIFELALEPKQFLEITGNHNDGFLITGDRYFNGTEAFIKQCLNAQKLL